MRFKDLNWMDVEKYLGSDNRIILITGATEQHGYLSLLSDVLIPSRIADSATGREDVLIAPEINFGVGTRFMDFPGTISIAQSTFDALLTDVVRSLLSHGFTHFLIINGHQKNRFPDALTELVEDDYTRIIWFDWWNSLSVREFEMEQNLKVQHANWSENFAFNRVTPVPDGEATTRLQIEDLDADMLLREQVGDGNLGGSYQIDDRLMFQLFDSVVEEVVELLIQLRQ